MNGHEQEAPTHARERLEQDAERVRARLLGNLDELKARRLNFEATLRRHPAILVGMGALALAACGFVLFARRARQRRERQRDAILGLAARVLGPAYVVEPVAERHSALKDSLKKAGSVLVAAAGREVGRRALLAVETRIAELEQAEGRAPA